MAECDTAAGATSTMGGFQEWPDVKEMRVRRGMRVLTQGGIFSKGVRNRASSHDREPTGRIWAYDGVNQAGGSARPGVGAGRRASWRACRRSPGRSGSDIEVFLMEVASNRVSRRILQVDRSLEILWPTGLAREHG